MFVLVLLGLNVQLQAQAFITTWQTTTANEMVVIPTFSGPVYNYSVDWGDGTPLSTGQTGDVAHTYTNAGTYTVQITGAFPRIYFNDVSSSSANTKKIQSIEQWGGVAWISMENAFAGCTNLTYNATDTPNLSGVTDMSNMFNGCMAFNGNIGGWDVSNITQMRAMFANATAFNQNIDNWNVSNVTDMGSMFVNASVFNQPLGSWNVGNVVDMSGMFLSAVAFNQDISSWNVENVTNMANMFFNAVVFNQPIGNWDMSKVTSIGFMFSGAIVFNQPIGNWNLGSVTSMNSTFVNAEVFNQDIGAWNVSNVTNMNSMFQSAFAFNQDISNWDVSNVTNMASMFQRARAFNQPIGRWNVGKVTLMGGMFNEAIAFDQGLSAWDVREVTEMDAMFAEANSFNQNLSAWNVSKVTRMDFMFRGASLFDQNLGNWNISLVTNMTSMLDNSGMSILNYDSTLNGWAAQSTQPNVTLGVARLVYCFGESSRNSLTNAPNNWTISGDTLDCSSVTPPSAPTNPSISSYTFDDNAITLVWTDDSNNEDGFKIERSANDTTNFVEIGKTQSNTTTFNDQNLVQEVQYFYKIVAFNSIGEASTIAISTVLVGQKEKLINRAVKVGPNPAKEVLNVTLSHQTLGKLQFRILNQKGKVVRTWTEMKHAYHFQKDIYIAYLPNGTYILEISLDQQKVIRRLIKK